MQNSKPKVSMCDSCVHRISWQQLVFSSTYTKCGAFSWYMIDNILYFAYTWSPCLPYFSTCHVNNTTMILTRNYALLPQSFLSWPTRKCSRHDNSIHNSISERNHCLSWIVYKSSQPVMFISQSVFILLAQGSVNHKMAPVCSTSGLLEHVKTNDSIIHRSIFFCKIIRYLTSM